MPMHLGRPAPDGTTTNSAAHRTRKPPNGALPDSLAALLAPVLIKGERWGEDMLASRFPPHWPPSNRAVTAGNDAISPAASLSKRTVVRALRAREHVIPPCETGAISRSAIEVRSDANFQEIHNQTRLKFRPIDRIFARDEPRFPSANPLPLPPKAAQSTQKSPASEEAGALVPAGQSPLRRDQIRLKPSSPSTLTSEA